MSRTVINNAVVVPMTDAGPRWIEGSIGWEGSRIAFVGAEPDGFRADTIIDGRGKVVMPGLINTHTHVAMTLLRNAVDDLPLMTWLREKVWPFEASLTADDIARGARLGIAEMLLGGTTTFVDMYWHEDAIAREAQKMGIRAVLCPCFVDGERMEEFERDLIETQRVAEMCERLSVRIAPHAAYSCSEANLWRAAELARELNLGLHIHLSETLDEQRIIRQRHGCTPTEYLLRLGLFERPVLAAHCVHVSEGDIEILRSHGVTSVHNPQSNMKLACGAAPIARMLEAGVNVSLGTDGPASNNDLDMFDEIRSAALLGKLTAGDPTALPAHEVLRMATVGGATAIGMAGELGVLQPGALADVIMIDFEKPHLRPLHDPVNALVYSVKSSDVCAVFIHGTPIDLAALQI